MNTYTNDQLSDVDIFFYYGKSDLDLETRSDIMQNLLQSRRSLFYDRSNDCAGIKDFENYPNTLGLQILLPYSIVDALSKRNFTVSAENLDRRVAVSQSTIKVSSDKNGIGINVFYIPFFNLENPTNLNIPLGVQK
jgi:hypothetical protein